MARKKKQNPEENQEKMLSFEELKNKVADESGDTDPEVESLLSTLRDIAPEEPEAEKTPEPAANEEKAQDASGEDYQSIYDDVMRSVMGKTNEETTSRKNRFLADGDQFVDVTEAYQDYGDVREHPEEKPVLPVTPVKEAPKTETTTEKAEADKTVEGKEAASDDAPADSEKAKAPVEEKQYRTFNEIFKDGFRKIFPNKTDSVGERLRKVIMDLSIVALVGCAVYFCLFAVQNWQAEKQHEDLKGQIIDDTDVLSESDVWADFISKYPNIQLPEGIMAKYAYLYAINQDLVGWVKIPNSTIDMQVVQAGDNSTYLKTDFYGNYSRYGCPYMDYRNDPKYLDQNTIIYGHHMSDGLVFADLKKYKTIDGFRESPVIEFDTLYRSYKFKIYAVIITNSKEEDDNGYIFNYTVPTFGTEENFTSYIAAVDERKLYTTGVDIRPDDKLLTLSTCTYEFSDARLVVIGRMVRDGEDETVDTSLAVVNENPRYPQVWYDKNGKTNPFAGAEQWKLK